MYVCEPVICDQSTFADGALIVNLCVKQMMIPQSKILFDIRAADTDTQSYHDRIPFSVLSSAKHKKKRKYSQACKERRATFTPLCVCLLRYEATASLTLRGLLTCYLPSGTKLMAQ